MFGIAEDLSKRREHVLMENVSSEVLFHGEGCEGYVLQAG